MTDETKKAINSLSVTTIQWESEGAISQNFKMMDFLRAVRTHPPRVMEEASFEATYDPSVTEELLAELASKAQDITIYSGELMYLGSPRSRLILNYTEKKFKGYLDSFEPVDAAEGEEPSMSVTVRII